MPKKGGENRAKQQTSGNLDGKAKQAEELRNVLGGAKAALAEGRMALAKNGKSGIIKGDDLYTATDRFSREVAKEDRHAFARSLANKTAGLADREVKTVEINGARNIYWFEADGYMHGTMLKSVDANDSNGYENTRKEFENGINSDTEIADLWANFISAERGGKESDFSHSRDGRRKGNADLFLEGKRESHSAGDQGRSDQNYKVDLKEVDELIAKLKKKFASEQGGDEQNTTFSDGTTERFAVSQGENSQTSGNLDGKAKQAEAAQKSAAAVRKRTRNRPLCARC